MKRLQESIKEQERTVQLNTRVLFEAIKGKTFILNPWSGYGKEFPPEEIEGILSGTIVNSETIIHTKGQTYFVGQPKEYPHALANALKTFFAKIPQVEESYLAQICYDDGKDKPHPIIGVKTQGDCEKIIKEAMIATKGLLCKNECVDFVEIKDGAEINKYFYSATPFYKRGWLNNILNAVFRNKRS